MGIADLDIVRRQIQQAKRGDLIFVCLGLAALAVAISTFIAKRRAEGCDGSPSSTSNNFCR